MTAPTVGVRFLIARAAVRATGVAHVVSQRDTGALNPVCGANPIRSRTVETWPDAVSFDGALCPDCAAIAPNLGGLAIVEVGLEQINVPAGARSADDQLIESIRHGGVQFPILVAPAAAGYRLVAGARRLDAARAAGLTTDPAIVRFLSPAETAVAGLLENLHRKDLDPIAQAHAYQDALAHFGSKAELGRAIGVSRAQISNTIRLLGLPLDVQARIAAGELTAEGGRAALRDIKDLKAAKPLVVEPQRDALAHALADYLGVRVTVTGKRIALDITDTDLPRLLAALRVEAAA